MHRQVFNPNIWPDVLLYTYDLFVLIWAIGDKNTYTKLQESYETHNKIFCCTKAEGYKGGVRCVLHRNVKIQISLGQSLFCMLGI